MSDVKRLHRLLRSLLVAGASLLIIVGAAFAGNALAPAKDVTVVAQSAVDDDSLEARDEDAPAVEIPEPPNPDEAEPDKVEAPDQPEAKDANEDPGAQGDEDDQGEVEDANDGDQNDNDDADEKDAAENDAAHNDAGEANDNHDGGGEHDSGGGDDSGEQGD